MRVKRLTGLVIIGGGFGGLHAARALRNSAVEVTLIDRRNFHLFQPLLYQVATGGLSPGDIAYPIRSVTRGARNIEVLAAEVVDFLPDEGQVILVDGRVGYDSLIVATGVSHHYFGHEDWAGLAPGLKSIEDALYIRRRILLAFEAAEREPDPERRKAWLTFVIVGGGPTGVELGGALADLSRQTLKNEFQRINPAKAQILLLEGLERVLHTFPPALSADAAGSLEKLGVQVRTQALVTGIDGDSVTVRDMESGDESQIKTRTVLWAAGVIASPLGQALADRTGAETDGAGRLVVQPDLTLPGYPEIFVAGDLAHFTHQTGEPLPGVAQVAMQGGEYAGRLILKRLKGGEMPPFHYRDRGNLAVIGRHAAVADFGRFKFSGHLAWFIWLFVHIYFLIGFANKLLVLVQWAWSYITRNRGARLITGERPYPLIEE